MIRVRPARDALGRGAPDSNIESFHEVIVRLIGDLIRPDHQCHVRKNWSEGIGSFLQLSTQLVRSLPLDKIRGLDFIQIPAERLRRSLGAASTSEDTSSAP